MLLNEANSSKFVKLGTSICLLVIFGFFYYKNNLSDIFLISGWVAAIYDQYWIAYIVFFKAVLIFEILKNKELSTSFSVGSPIVIGVSSKIIFLILVSFMSGFSQETPLRLLILVSILFLYTLVFSQGPHVNIRLKFFAYANLGLVPIIFQSAARALQ